MFRSLVVLLLSCLLALVPAETWAQAPLKPVVLQLKWSHGFQFAGYYAAQQLGYYRAAGLEVELRPSQEATDVVQEVVQGRAQFAVGNSSLLLARSQGAPVVVLAVLFQHSPLVLLARSEQANQTLHDLIGRRVMIEPHAEELLAYLKVEGVPLDWLQLQAHSRNPQALVNDEADAMSAYVSTEPYFLDQAGLRYQIYTPRSAGIDFYGDNLFTSQALLQQQPELVKAFREASLRGWQYAMAHPDEVIAMIRAHHAPELSEKFLAYEARSLRPLIQPDLVEVGYMYPGRWQHIAQTYADLGLMPVDFDLGGFLYQPGPPGLPRWAYPALAVMAALGALAFYILRINRRLSAALHESKEVAESLRASEERMRHMAQHDQLTGLANRALFTDRLTQAIAMARRDGTRLAVLFIDLDRFKPINDEYGHGVGDLLLQHVAQALRQAVRASDTVARIGGDEFVVLLRKVDTAAQARQVATKLEDMMSRPLTVAGRTLQASASIGLALYPDHGRDEVELTKHADLAMYQAKQARPPRGAG